MIRTIVVDDQELVRQGLLMVCESAGDIEVVAQAADGAEAIEAVRRHRVDVVVMDIRMPRVDGVAATRSIAGMPAPPKVLVLTTFDLDELAVDALRAGASGFILKDAPGEEIVAAIRHVHSGGAILAPSTTRRLLEHLVTRPRGDVGGVLARLTEREREVFLAVARGLSNAEIAGQLYLSETTVKTHLRQIMSKLGLRDRIQAVVLAYETGVIVPGEAGEETGV